MFVEFVLDTSAVSAIFCCCHPAAPPDLAHFGQASHLAALPPCPNTTNTRKTRSTLHSYSIPKEHASHYSG